jgi:hypothetical protein
MTRLAIFTSLLAFLSVSLLVMQWGRNETLELENSGLKTTIYAQKEEFMGKTGQMMARIRVAEVGKRTLEELARHHLDSLQREFGQRLKRIEQYQAVQTNTVNHLLMDGTDVNVLNSKGDSSKVKVFHYQDKWTTRNDTLEGNRLRSSTQTRNDFKILIRKGKRSGKWWQVWKGRQLIAEAYSGNPDTQITDFQLLKAIDK